MASHSEVVKRWVAVALGNHHRLLHSGASVHVYEGDRDRIYSWGKHFELGRLLRNKQGKPRLFLLNGDVRSGSTSRHQWLVRSEVQKSGIPVLIIPYSSLDAANIDYETIKPLFIAKDGWEDIEHESDEVPAGAEYVQCWSRPVVTMEAFDERPIGYPGAERFIQWNSETQKMEEKWKQYVVAPQESVWKMGFLHKGYVPGTEEVYENVAGRHKSAPHFPQNRLLPVREVDGRFYWTTKRHTLGDSAFRAKVIDHRSIRAACVPCKGTGKRAGWPNHPWMRCETCHGMGVRKTYKRWATFLSSFDQQERGIFYFLCEMPHNSMPASLGEALEMLKPEAVKMAEMSNKLVLRQGDIFFIETDLDDDYVKAVSHEIGAARGVDNIKEARKQWYRMTDEQRLWRTNPHNQKPCLALLGQRHSATRVAHTKDGLHLAKGRAYHLGGEHRPFDLGNKESWFVAVKNTCPITKR